MAADAATAAPWYECKIRESLLTGFASCPRSPCLWVSVAVSSRCLFYVPFFSFVLCAIKNCLLIAEDSVIVLKLSGTKGTLVLHNALSAALEVLKNA